eukprot:2063115-Rhodomonas_salina.3
MARGAGAAASACVNQVPHTPRRKQGCHCRHHCQVRAFTLPSYSMFATHDGLFSMTDTSRENGKTKVDAIGDVTRGIEVVEHALAMPTLMMGTVNPLSNPFGVRSLALTRAVLVPGDSIEQITNNMDTKSIRQVIPLSLPSSPSPLIFSSTSLLPPFHLAIARPTLTLRSPSRSAWLRGSRPSTSLP